MANLRAIKNEIENLMDRMVLGIVTAGNVWWVDSVNGNALNSGTEKDRAVVGLQAAINLSAANDYIVILEGHAETVATAGAIDINKAGLTIIGLGSGSTKPTFTLSTTASDVDIDAVNVTLRNLRFVSSVNSLLNFIDVNFEYFKIEDCDFVTSSTFEALCFIILASTVDNHIIRGCTFFQPTDPDGTLNLLNQGCIYSITSDNVLVENCRFEGFFETAIFHIDTSAQLNYWIQNCTGSQSLSTAFTVSVGHADTTGGMSGCYWTMQAAVNVTPATLNIIPGTCSFQLTESFWMNDNVAGGQLGSPGDLVTS